MSSSVTHLSQDELRQRVQDSCSETYQAGLSRCSITGIPYQENPYWNDLESRIFNILKDSLIQVSQFKIEFTRALLQAKREAYAKIKRFDGSPGSPPLVSGNWKFAAIVLGSIALSIILTVVIVVPTVTFLI